MADRSVPKHLEELRARSPEFKEEYDKLEPEYASRRIVLQLVQLRQKANVTQEELARRMGVGHSSIEQLELHTDSPTVETVAQYVQALGYELTVEFERNSS